MAHEIKKAGALETHRYQELDRNSVLGTGGSDTLYPTSPNSRLEGNRSGSVLNDTWFSISLSFGHQLATACVNTNPPPHPNRAMDLSAGEVVVKGFHLLLGCGFTCVAIGWVEGDYVDMTV